MKKIFLWLVAIFAILFIAILVTPYVFKGKILETVKSEINKQVNADVKFDDFSLSIFSSFPNLTIEMENLSIVGKASFSNDTLLFVPLLNINIDLANAISGNIAIKEILISNPLITARLDSLGVANYDIMVASEADTLTASQVSEELVDNKSESGSVQMLINAFEIKNATIRYIDDSSKMAATISGLDFLLHGDFKGSSSNLFMTTNVNSLSFSMEGVDYLKAIPMSANVNLSADFDKSIYTLKENTVKIDEVVFNFQGDVKMEENGIATNLTFNAPETTFKNLLKLVPEFILKDLDKVKTSGNLALEGYVKGIYVDADHLPSFELLLGVSDGQIQYPDLPKAIEAINIEAGIHHPGNGDADLMVVDINKFGFTIGGNPVMSEWTFKTPISDLYISGLVNGKIDLASLKTAMPLEASDLSGFIVADMKMMGNMSTIEKEEYEKFVAEGYLSLKSFLYKSADLPQGMYIKDATLDFSPKQINLKSFNATIGQSDMSMSGYIANYIPYIFKNDVVDGKLLYHSKFLNVNEFMVEEPVEAGSSVGAVPTDSVAEEHFPPFMVPDKMNFVVNSTIDKILYDNLSITNVSGDILIKDKTAKLNNLKMTMLDGQVVMNGQYNTQDTIKPYLSTRLVLNSLNINKVGNSFSSVRKLAPIVTQTEGLISGDMSYYCLIIEDMMPDMASIKSKGYIESPGLIVKNNKALDELATRLKDNNLKTLKTSSLHINFIVEDSKVVLEPFDVTVNKKPFAIAGSHSLDNQMAYTVKTELAANEIGGDVQKWVSMVSNPNKKYPVTVKIDGDMTKPNISLDLKEATEALMKDATKGGGDAVKSILKKLF